MSGLLPSSRFAAWLTSNPPQAHSRRRSQPENLLASPILESSSPPPAKRLCVRETKSAPVSPRSRSSFTTSHSPFDPTSSDLAQPSTSSTSGDHKPTKTQRKRLSYVKQTAKRIRKIIDATFAVCEGTPLNTDSRALAYPVHKIKRGLFYVPASFSDFQVLRQYKGTTNALWATTQYEQAALIPGRTTYTPCKNATNEVKNPQPDGSLRVKGANFPFLVLEIASTQSDESIENKIHHWVQGNRDHLRFIIVIKIESKASTRRVLASVIRPRRQNTPTADNPHAYAMEGHRIIDKKEIYPTTSKTTFKIARADVLPRDANDDFNTSANPMTFSIYSFGTYAMQAVQDLEEEEGAGKGSPRNPNQALVASPAGSDRQSFSSTSSSGHEDPKDLDYEGREYRKDELVHDRVLRS
ncbi:MAG: hypothetical protein Q9209_002448 [Squamulea sp. 1 TL-2023]